MKLISKWSVRMQRRLLTNNFSSVKKLKLKGKKVEQGWVFQKVFGKPFNPRINGQISPLPLKSRRWNWTQYFSFIYFPFSTVFFLRLTKCITSIYFLTVDLWKRLSLSASKKDWISFVLDFISSYEGYMVSIVFSY